MSDTELVLGFADRSACEAEFRAHLRLGRAFVRADQGITPGSAVRLLLTHPETTSVLAIPCVVTDAQHDGHSHVLRLDFVDQGPETVARIGGFLAETPADPEEEPTSDGDPNLDPEGPPDPESPFDAALDDALQDADGRADTIVNPRVERLRNLNEAQRMQVARGSVLEDRVMLERLYGPSVWPLLLHNPKISVAEVARIGRKGTVPRPLLDYIAENEGWIRQSLIRRALLANPKLGPESAMRILRATPPRELKLVPQQTAYPTAIRTLAQRLLRGSQASR